MAKNKQTNKPPESAEEGFTETSVKKQLFLWSKMSIHRPQQRHLKIYPETCSQIVTQSSCNLATGRDSGDVQIPLNVSTALHGLAPTTVNFSNFFL